MAKQDYKIEIILQADVTETPVRDWLTDALSEGHWKYRTLNIYSTDITAFDRENPNYKWLKDMVDDTSTEES